MSNIRVQESSRTLVQATHTHSNRGKGPTQASNDNLLVPALKEQKGPNNCHNRENKNTDRARKRKYNPAAKQDPKAIWNKYAQTLVKAASLFGEAKR